MDAPIKNCKHALGDGRHQSLPWSRSTVKNWNSSNSVLMHKTRPKYGGTLLCRNEGQGWLLWFVH